MNGGTDAHGQSLDRVEDPAAKSETELTSRRRLLHMGAIGVPQSASRRSEMQ